MRPLGRFALLAAVVFATGGARFFVRVQPSPRPRVQLAPALVLARYKAGLAAIVRPKSLVYQYSVEQLGLQNLEQAHRVYRSGGNERDETLMVDGYTLEYPSIRIFRNRFDRYDIGAVAPRPARYSFAYSRVLAYAGGDAYVFKTVPVATGAFAVSEVEIDGRTFLPSVVRFKIAGNGARGSGELRFGPSQRYWLVRQASVSAHLKHGATAHERITWSNYQFPSSLPDSTFTPPHIVTPLPAPTPAPTPVGAPLSPL